MKKRLSLFTVTIIHLIFLYPRMCAASKKDEDIEKGTLIKHSDGTFTSSTHQEHFEEAPNGGKTLHGIFVNSVSAIPHREFTGSIENDKITYRTYLDVYNDVLKLHQYMLQNGFKKKDIIGLLGPNCEEWFIIEQALLKIEAINCPIYPSFGIENFEHVCKETEMEILFISGNQGKFLGNCDVFSNPDVNIKQVICFGQIDSDLLRKIRNQGVEIISLKESMDKIKIKRCTADEVMLTTAQMNSNPNKLDMTSDELDNVVTICYTSGTSGLPKGAMLTNQNFIGIVGGFSAGPNARPILDVNDEIVYVSYLPLAHVMERLCFYVIVSVGGKIGFWRGDPAKLQADLEIIKPKMFPGVPRAFERIKDAIKKEVASKGCIARKIFDWALRYKIWRQKSSQPAETYSSTLLDYFVFSKITEKFGGAFVFGLTGSAPLDPRTGEFFQAVFSMKIYEGYGQTEALGANTLQAIGSNAPGSVGIPFPCIKVKFIADKDGNNEICLKGQSVFKGYYKNPEKTKQVIDSDGWLHTGDRGYVEEGQFYIDGRISENFKLENGEFVCPSKIEAKLKLYFMKEFLIWGKNTKRFVLGIVFCTDTSLKHDEIRRLVIENAKKCRERSEIATYEIPRDVLIIEDEPTIENLMLTVTGKVRRNAIFTRYKDDIDRIVNSWSEE